MCKEKIDSLNNLVSDWEKKISLLQPLTFQNQMVKLLDRFKLIISHIHLLQSEALADRHWKNIFSILHLPLKLRSELKLKHISQAMQSFETNMAELKMFIDQAKAEQIVWQALMEIEQWSVKIELTFFEHLDSNGRTIRLIKGISEVVLKVNTYYISIFLTNFQRLSYISA